MDEGQLTVLPLQTSLSTAVEQLFHNMWNAPATLCGKTLPQYVERLVSEGKTVSWPLPMSHFFGIYPIKGEELSLSAFIWMFVIPLSSFLSVHRFSGAFSPS